MYHIWNPTGYYIKSHASWPVLTKEKKEAKVFSSMKNAEDCIKYWKLGKQSVIISCVQDEYSIF